MKHPFEYQKPTEEQVVQIQEVREACKSLYETLQKLPNYREKSLAITKLEESSMWANKCIVFQE
jgi:flagellar biosynthesis chaperone FliJ